MATNDSHEPKSASHGVEAVEHAVEEAIQRGKSSRVAVGMVAGLFMIGMIIVGGWPWVILVTLAFWQAFQELNQIYSAKQTKPSKVIVLTIGAVLILLAAFGKVSYFLPVITVGIIGSFIRLLFRKPVASIHDIGATFLAIFYVGFLPIHYILLRNLDVSGSENITPAPWEQSGMGYVFLIMAVVSFSDIAAYYVGKYLGRNPLYPEVSPKKTKEGALGGVLIGLMVGVSVGTLIGIPLQHSIILSLLIVIAGQLGDLSESMMKRDAGVKDSGSIMASHGGLLDRMDSYLFSGAVSYYYIHWVVLQQGLGEDLLHLLPSLH